MGDVESENPLETIQISHDDQANLNDLTSITDETRSFSCSYENCSKSFTRKDHLKRHKLTHLGEKAFHCSYPNCTTSFYTKYHLKRHLITHEKPQPYSCF